MAKKPEKQKPIKEMNLKVKQNLNNPKDWANLHTSTFSRQLNKMGAYGDKLLDTDDDLPLARHLQLFTIVGIVFVGIF